MSLQVCDCCGWSKVTTYHGLRVHQGRMGCTPRGATVAEPRQQYAWNLRGQTNVNLSYKLEVRNTVKIESSNYYSDMSLQTCHCGWKKMTNYHGLRTHQGMMGCMPKGVRIPKEEQSVWRDHWKPQLDNKKLPVTKKVNTKEENSPEIPKMRNFSNPTSAAKVKKENKSASSQKSTRPKSRHQLEERFTPLKTSEEYWSAASCDNYITAASRIKTEPMSSLEVCIPRYPDDPSWDVRDESSFYLQMNHRLDEIPAVQPEDRYGSLSEHPRAPTPSLQVPHREKDSLLPTPIQETPRSQLLKEIQNCLEKYKKRRDEKMVNSARETVDESPRISHNSVIKAESLQKNPSCLPSQQHPLKKPTETKTAAAEQRIESVRKCSTTQPPVPAKRKSLLLFTGSPEKAEGPSASADGEMRKNYKTEELKQNVRQTTKVSSTVVEKNSPPPSLRNPTDTKVTSSEQVSRAAPPVVPPKRNFRSFRVRQLSVRDITNDLERANREIKVKELVRMFSVSAAQENTGGTKEEPASEHPRVLKLLTQRHPALPAQETKVQPKVEDRKEKRTTDIKPDITATAAEVPEKESPSWLCAAAKPDVPTNMKVKQLAQMFSTQETATGPKEKRGLEHRPLQVKLMAQRFLQPTSTDAVGQLKKVDHARAQRAQAQQDRMKVQLQQKIHIREQKMIEVRSAAKSCKGSLDDEWLQIHSVFSEVMKVVEDARKKALEPIEKRRRKVKRDEQNLLQKLQGEIDRLRDSIDKLDRSQDLQAVPPPNLTGSKEIKDLKVDTSFSFGTLKATTSTMVKDIQWHLENLSSLELKRIATFAVDVKLDSATAHQCLVLSNDGKRVRDGGEKPKAPDKPERFDTFGSVLGINRLNRGRAYWEVEVKNKSGWDLGVARRSANRKGVLKVNTDNGYWVAVHFKDRKYAALTVPPTSLPLSEKPQKVGVFVDYEEGVVSFYDVMNQSHIFSFTECLFNEDILPYFSPHPKMNDKNVDPLIISAV